MATHQEYKNIDEGNHAGAIVRTGPYNRDIVHELQSLGYGTMNECINASYECINYNDINDVRDELTKHDSIIPNFEDNTARTPSPPLYRNRAYHIFTDPPPSDSCQTPRNITIHEWIYSDDETPCPPSPNHAETGTAAVLCCSRNESVSSSNIIEKKNTDSASKLMPLTLEVPPFFKLMASFSGDGYEHDDDELKDLEDETDRVQLYEVIRDITNMGNHSDFAKNVLLLTHPLVTNSNTILKCLEQRVFRDDYDSDCRVSSASTDSTNGSSPSITTASHDRSIPSFTSFSNISELTLNSHVRSRTRSSDASFHSNAPILSSFLVQTKVIEFIRFWMMEYWREDWEHNFKLRSRCKLFIRRYKEHEKVNLTRKEIEKGLFLINLLERTMKSQQRGRSSKLSEFFGDKVDCNTPLSPPSILNMSALTLTQSKSNSNSKSKNKSKHFMGIDERLVAEQMTLIMFNIFQKIKARECLDQNWKKPQKYMISPNISHYIDKFNKITKWIQKTILYAINVKERVLTIKKWLKVQEHLYKLSNFMGISVVGCALSSNAIYKLKDAWYLVEKKHNKQWRKHQEMKRIMTKIPGNWNTLRELQKNATGSMIPFFPMFATDIIAIEELNKKRVKNGTINFPALCKMNDTINKHLDHQSKAYNDVKSDATLQLWIDKQLNVAAEYSEEHLYDVAKAIVLKDQKELGNKSKIQR